MTGEETAGLHAFSRLRAALADDLEAGGGEVPVERKRLADAFPTHDREADSVTHRKRLICIAPHPPVHRGRAKVRVREDDVEASAEGLLQESLADSRPHPTHHHGVNLGYHE